MASVSVDSRSVKPCKLNLEKIDNDGAFVVRLAGATLLTSKWSGVEVRPGSKNRAKQKIQVSREAGRASCLLRVKCRKTSNSLIEDHPDYQAPRWIMRLPLIDC